MSRHPETAAVIALLVTPIVTPAGAYDTCCDLHPRKVWRQLLKGVPGEEYAKGTFSRWESGDDAIPWDVGVRACLLIAQLHPERAEDAARLLTVPMGLDVVRKRPAGVLETVLRLGHGAWCALRRRLFAEARKEAADFDLVVASHEGLERTRDVVERELREKREELAADQRCVDALEREVASLRPELALFGQPTALPFRGQG